MIHSEWCQAKTVFEGQKCTCQDAHRNKVEITVTGRVSCANCGEKANVELLIAPSADNYNAVFLAVGSTTPPEWARGSGRIDRHAGWRRFFCPVCKVEATR